MIRRLFRTFTALILLLSLLPLTALAANDHTCAPNASSDCTVCKLAGLINALPVTDAPIPETGDTNTPILFAAIAAIAAIALIKRRAFAR